MRLPKLQISVAITALLGLCSMGTFCVLPDANEGAPPDPSFSCADGEPPAADEAGLFFSDPGGGASPLPADTVLQLEYGPQGGQHVMVTVRHHTSSDGVWAYRLAFQPDAGEPGTPAPEAPRAPVLEGSNTVPVNACASGWTETTAPMFINIMDSGLADAAGEIPKARGMLRLVATPKEAGEKASAEVRVQIAM
ncbi:hypothetical protein WME89_46255 [Sorangium sp. So ce321]|uniref:hypothetical protein n=1 Tax=Sorangium sp. So ce321 TaxID=3133300 RepID=UPI003F5F50AD